MQMLDMCVRSSMRDWSSWANFWEDNNDEADDGATIGSHIWIHEGVWEYMGGRGYVRIRGDECGQPASNIKWLMSPPF